MNKILPFIEKETSGKSYKTHKYYFDDIEMPSLIYEDNQNVTLKKYGETEKIKLWIIWSYQNLKTNYLAELPSC